ncbi:hypothetical protein BH09PAT1_BH09PAT1_3370 [soil metagenome]
MSVETIFSPDYEDVDNFQLELIEDIIKRPEYILLQLTQRVLEIGYDPYLIKSGATAYDIFPFRSCVGDLVNEEAINIMANKLFNAGYIFEYNKEANKFSFYKDPGQLIDISVRPHLKVWQEPDKGYVYQFRIHPLVIPEPTSDMHSRPILVF